jgi:uncharacterized protein (DUF1501 family)
MDLSRRRFLQWAGCGFGGATLTAVIEQMSLATALAAQPSGYQALVCIFLAGGNDGNNTLIPYDNYDQYYGPVRSPSGLAIAKSSLLQITPSDSQLGTFGLHPSLPELRDFYVQKKLAILCNVGPLVQPLTKDLYYGGAPKPYQLFSHADQVAQWQSARAGTRSSTGWGGRIADVFPPHSSGFPMVTSINGTPLFVIGANRRPLSIAPAPTTLNNVLVLNGFGTSGPEVARRTSFDYLRTVDNSITMFNAASAATQQGVDLGKLLNMDPTLNTVFPNTTIGNQLKQVAKVIAANLTFPGLGLDRQIFFVSLGGFDTHQTQVGNQAKLLTDTSAAMAAFYNATVELQVSQSVVTFTLSDFGRAFQPSGNGAGTVGSDHAWGNHHFILGDAVQGGDFYGIPMDPAYGGNGTVYPTLLKGGPYDTDNGSGGKGRWIPTVAVDQYAATLAAWFGVSSSDLYTVFPNLGNFNPATLGFMG